MGADRRGPLAAFVVIAIIAAVLLVTSVRSQAAPGWLDPDNLPATIVAAPPVTDPHLWLSVSSGIPQAVRHGVVIVKRMAPDPGQVKEPTTLIASHSGPSRHRHPSDDGHAAGRSDAPPAVHPDAPPGVQDAPPGAHGHHHGQTQGHSDGPGVGYSLGPSHGRHLGWSRS